MTTMKQIDRSDLAAGMPYLLLTQIGWEIGTYFTGLGSTGFNIHGGRFVQMDYAHEIYPCPGDLNETKFAINDNVSEDEPGHVAKLVKDHWYVMEGHSGYRVGKWMYDQGTWHFKDNLQNVYDIHFVMKVYAIEPPRKVVLPERTVKVKTMRVKFLVPFMHYSVGKESDLPETQAASLIQKGIAQEATAVAVGAEPASVESKDIQAPPANKQIIRPRGRK